MVALAASAAAALTWLAARGAWSYVRRRSMARAIPAPAPSSRPPLPPIHEVPKDARRLADLPVGSTARLLDAHLDGEARAQIRALGLIDASVLRVCKQGEPCVVQVRTTRIGISSRIAQHVFVTPTDGRASLSRPN